ncbi:hypothetical protein [Ferrovum sp. PN-J185]|uniref:hypothetical protein n=1 Tax=Ferrovum sp. PN-J185 TaxID=1356306 RepID=UPI00079446B3|nr:hypothetical protein [Ferrovum sp. PN-J185]KXW55158.1 hypothetical protein FV185_18550 [Ferrovum sp. PN-J185]
MKKIIFLTLSLLTLFSNSYADEERHFRERHFVEFHDRDVHCFHPRELRVWERGRWIQATRGGLYGWWWVIGPRWFYYTAPIYPYPMMVSERVVFVNATPPVSPVPPTYVSPQATTIVPPSPPMYVSPQATTVVPSSPPPAIQMRYFCPSLNGYYPEIAQCPEPWRRVNAIPPGPIAR